MTQPTIRKSTPEPTAEPESARPGEPPPATAGSIKRKAFLEHIAADLGRAWAEQWRRDLQGQGRPAAGGWPGTMREARACIESALPTVLERRKMAAITREERESSARAAYASARLEWRRHADEEAP